MKEEAKLSLG